MARPSEFSPEMGDLICELVTGGKTLSEVCRLEEMPARATVERWKERHEAFRDKYARARVALMELWADEIITIADDDRGDIVIDGKTGEASFDHGRVQRDRLKIDTRKFLMSKVAPRLYGEKPEDSPASKLAINTGVPRMRVSWVGSSDPDNDSPVEGVKPIFDDNGNIISGGKALRARIHELEARLAGEAPMPEQPPKQITYQPAPVPGDLDADDWALLNRVLRLVKDTMPEGSDVTAAETFKAIESALTEKFR